MPKCSMTMVEILECSPKRRSIGVQVSTVIPRFTCSVLVMAQNFIHNCIDYLSSLLYDWHFVSLPTSTGFEVMETNTELLMVRTSTRINRRVQQNERNSPIFLPRVRLKDQCVAVWQAHRSRACLSQLSTKNTTGGNC